MTTTENEYYILSELIGMDDRHLAQKIELLLWASSWNVNQAYMNELIALMNSAPTAIEFYALLPKWVESKGQRFSAIKSEDLYKCAMPGYKKMAFGKPRYNSRGEEIEYD